MIGYLNGKLIWANANSIIISVNGIGYEINYFNNLTSSDFGQNTELFITHKISEFGQTLFGFKTIEEKIIFEELDNIKGVGSKAIFNIMSTLEIDSFAKLQTLKLDQLTAVKGVGKSIAQKLLLGISTKLKKDFDLNPENTPLNSKEIEKEYNDVINMLVEWGYKRKDLITFLAQNTDEIKGKNVEKIIEFTLKKLK